MGKMTCKETQAKYKVIYLDKNEKVGTVLSRKDEFIIRYKIHESYSMASHETCQGIKVPKCHFLVKIQIPIGSKNEKMSKLMDDDKDPLKAKGKCMVYNEDRSLHGWTKREDPLTKELFNVIMEKGVGGLKGYFYAIKEDNKIKINTVDIQPPENW